MDKGQDASHIALSTLCSPQVRCQHLKLDAEAAEVPMT